MRCLNLKFPEVGGTCTPPDPAVFSPYPFFRHPTLHFSILRLIYGNTARLGLVCVSRLNKSTVSGKDLYSFCLRGGVFVKRRKCKQRPL
jgi:hypothetical protein